MDEYVYKKVDKIQFSLLSPKMIKKMAAAKIVTAELYDKEGYPVDGGLMDIRLGVIDPGIRCKTCSGKLKDCTGHFGYIEIARPIIHVNYAKMVLIFLQSSCRGCGRFLLPDEILEKYREKLEFFEKMDDLTSKKKLIKLLRSKARATKVCPHCEEKQIAIKLEKPTTFFEENKRISPIEIRMRLERIIPSDAILIGIDSEHVRPEWMVLEVLPIPPVTMRPSITLESGERAEDDLTHKLGDIVRINQRLFENINAGAPEIIVEDLWDLLQYHITTFFDNNISQIPPARHRSGQPLKTLAERIKSKEGRFRHNLAGKRVNYSARTVISPDPKIAFNEVGIPQILASELTIPIRVTEWNLEWIKKFVKNGPNNYPGANYVYVDGKKKKITDETQEQILEELAPGHVVSRHLINGDITIFNRQPSLHRMSIMGHKVKVLPGKSFRLNPAVCAPYNADFDGDEMNLHVPQTEEAQAEAEILMEVQTQIISPKNGLNVIGCTQDSISGLYLLTRSGDMSKEEAVELLLSVGVDKPKRFKKFKKIITGKEIFSTILPDDFEFVGFSKAYTGETKPKIGDEGYVVIKKGEMVSGVIDKNTIGSGNGTLFRDIKRRYDEETSVDIYGKMFRLGIAYLLKRGFSIKTSDSDLNQEIKIKIKKRIKQAIKDVETLIEEKEKGKLKPYSGKTIEETLELKILQKLNKIRNDVGNEISKIEDTSNSSLIMAQCGAAGSVMNLAQTAALVGQQALRGKRIERGFKGRTLSLFKKGDLTPLSRGFIRHSFKKGINPVEFFFHAMTGRDSLMDTALRTPKSGYLYRRLANALQDLRIEYDHTVRDANKSIVQFCYGDDGMDVAKSDKGTIDIRKIISEVLGE